MFGRRHAYTPCRCFASPLSVCLKFKKRVGKVLLSNRIETPCRPRYARLATPRIWLSHKNMCLRIDDAKRVRHDALHEPTLLHHDDDTHDRLWRAVRSVRV
jgi:hypothetical protein